MNLLKEILAAKKREVESARRLWSYEALFERSQASGRRPLGFKAALKNAFRKPAVIAEIKRRSPSKGDLNPGIDAAQWARLYEENGAAAVSVLTDEKYFGGSLKDLKAARGACGLPLLRKDFLVDPYQVLEAYLAGADAVLLIAEALPKKDLCALYKSAREAGLDVLLELHGEEEIEKAGALPEAVVGINNRDLKTFRVDLNTTIRLATSLKGRVVVSESGIRNSDDLARLRAAGVDAILVGESLVTSPDPADTLRELVLS